MTLLLLHGFGGTPAAFDSLLRFESLDAQDVLRPSISAGGSSFEEEVDRVAALLPEGTDVFGYSLGGRIALGLLARHPGRVRSLVLAGAHPGLDEPAARRERRLLDAQRAEQVATLGVGPFFEGWDAQPLFGRRPRPDRTGLTAPALARMFRVLGLGTMPSYWEALSRARCALSYLVGEDDDRYLDIARRVAVVCPDARILTVPASDHDVLGCQPEFVASAIAETIAARRGSIRPSAPPVARRGADTKRSLR